MKKDEWILSKELGRLRKYGLYLNAERIQKNEKYNIVHERSRNVLEPSCSVEEIMGITNVLEWYIKKTREINEKTNKGTNNMGSDRNNVSVP